MLATFLESDSVGLYTTTLRRLDLPPLEQTLEVSDYDLQVLTTRAMSTEVEGSVRTFQDMREPRLHSKV